MVEGLRYVWCGEFGFLALADSLRTCYTSFDLRCAFCEHFIVFSRRSLGDLSDEGTPGPIPNPAVKLVSADGTWGATPWESRSLPRDLFYYLEYELERQTAGP